MTATVYSGALRYFKQRSRGIKRRRWKRAIVWYCMLAIGGFFVVNWIYQVIRKPGELLAPMSSSLSKSPESTWQSYGPFFEKHSTSILSPEFLAALAQIEGAGNPVARTYWRWQWSWNPFEVYRPASSALVRPTVMLVQQLLYPDSTEPFERNDRRVPPQERAEYTGCSSQCRDQRGTKTKAGCRDSPVRLEERRDLCRARLPANRGRALRDSQPAPVSQSN